MSVITTPGTPWTFLGRITLGSAAITCGPVIWTGAYKQLMIKYRISGYNGGAVGRLLMGPGTPNNSGATNGTSFGEGSTTPSTLISAAGIPLAVTVSAIGRSGTIWVDGESGSLKEVDVVGHNGTPAAATAATLFRASSFFTDLGTNLFIQQAQLSVYLAITGSTISASTTFNSGTSIAVWGKNDN